MKDTMINSIDEQIKIGIVISAFEFNFQVSRNKKLKNIRKMDSLKENIQKYLKDFTLQKYSLHFVPDLNKNEEEPVSEWVLFAQNNRIRPAIVIRSRNQPQILVCIKIT